MPEQLWATTMDPSKRTLRRLTVEDAAATSAVFSLLMGQQACPPSPARPGAGCALIPAQGCASYSAALALLLYCCWIWS